MKIFSAKVKNDPVIYILALFSIAIHLLFILMMNLAKMLKNLFRKITKVGSISNPDAREFRTTVYLCQDPVMSFNMFWTERLTHLDE